MPQVSNFLLYSISPEAGISEKKGWFCKLLQGACCCLRADVGKTYFGRDNRDGESRSDLACHVKMRINQNSLDFVITPRAPAVRLCDGVRNPHPRAGGEGSCFVQTHENITNITAGHLNHRGKLQPVPFRIALDPTAKVCIQRCLGLGKSSDGCLTGTWPSKVPVTTVWLSGPFPWGGNKCTYTELLFHMPQPLAPG